jgi:tRNA-2-methylthio-N6-dimethylallyladenosine synthase
VKRNNTGIPQADIIRQREYMSKIFKINSGRTERPLASVDTYGCQQNEADSERLRGMLREMGFRFTDDKNKADVILINTCAIREHAETRVLGNVGALTHTKRRNPDQIIALCGCMVQQEHMAKKIRRSFRHVDLVFGPHALWRFPELFYRIMTERGRIFSVEDSDGEISEGLPVMRDGNAKAWLSIMYGCNNFCSYCIVPYVRGRERSRDPEIILAEARELVASGFKDITLLGQNVNSYGNDFDGNYSFTDLLREIDAIPGEFIIRFMTSHPKDAGEELFRTMAECEKVERHIHLPFQSGSDRILKAMNRGYTKEGYLSLIKSARKHMPEIVITSDIIVGFPGETEEDFLDTLDVIEKAEFDALFTFIYSKRSGTPAADMEDFATREEKLDRFNRLLELQNSISEQKHAALVGTVQRVLVDGEAENELYPYNARTNGGRLVHIAGRAEIGSFYDVLITDSNTWALYAEIN